MLLKAANQGHIKAQYQLLKWYRQASEGNLEEMSTEDGFVKDKKVNIPSSKEKMLFWMNKLVEEGDPKIQNLLGKAYLNGDFGLDKNYNKARALFEKSASQEYPGGLMNLAECYEKGLGVEKDIQKAIDLYDQAGQKGNGYAYKRLRDIYSRGSEGVPQDLEKAQEYNEKALKTGPWIDEVEIWFMMPF